MKTKYFIASLAFAGVSVTMALLLSLYLMATVPAIVSLVFCWKSDPSDLWRNYSTPYFAIFSSFPRFGLWIGTIIAGFLFWHRNTNNICIWIFDIFMAQRERKKVYEAFRA